MLFRATLCLPLLVLSLAGCSAIQAGKNRDLDRELVAGNFKGAALMVEGRLGAKPQADGSLPPVVADGKNVLDHLDAGESWMLAGDPDRSIHHFDAAELALKGTETQNVASSSAKMVGASLFNEALNDYVPSPAEAVLINYYKALNFLKKGDPDNARVELNRSGDRTRRAVDRYAAEIAEADAKASGDSAGQSYSNPKIKSGIDSNFPEMAQWAPYKEFIVPPATYLQALYLGRSRDPDDRQKATDLYGRILGLTDSNEAVALDAIEVAKTGICPGNNCTWVLVEHGLGPDLQEKRFDLPVVMSNGLIVASIALPSLQSRTTTDELPVRISVNQQVVQVPLLGSMDRVVQTEFQKRFPGLVTRAVISATAKAVAQNEINKQNAIAGLIANIASAATTGADLRSWRGIPGRWSLVRLNGVAGQALLIESLAGAVEVQMPSSGSHLVYVRAVSNTAKPVVEVLPI